MQADNNNYQTDEQFTNKGWNEMLKTLDQEMPVEGKKRRGFFWLFFLIGVGIVGSLWAFYPENFNQENNQLNSQNAIISINPSIENNENLNKIINQEVLTDDNINIKSAKANNTISKTKQYNYENKNTSESIDFPSILETSFPPSQPVIEEIIPIEKTIEEVKPTRLNAAVFIEPSFITIELQESEKLIFAEKEFVFEPSPTIKKEEKPKREKEFGVFAGGLIDLANTNELGAFGGGSIHFPIGKRFGIKTGLGYSVLRKEISYQFIGTQNAAIIPDVMALPLPVSEILVHSRTDFVLKQFHHLDLPILLTYLPHKKIQIQLGVNASYLIKEKLEVLDNTLQVEEFASANLGIGISAVDLNSITLKQYADENYWNKFDLSSVIGVAWKPTSKLNIELQYHRGWLPLLKSNKQELVSPIQGPTLTGRTYEVYDLSFQSADVNEISNKRFFEKILNKENFRKFNQSIRLSIGYNF